MPGVRLILFQERPDYNVIITVAGIVSIGDLVRPVITVQGEPIQYLQQYINGQYQR